MNMTNELQKQGFLMQKRWLKTIGQGFQVETYKERGGKTPFWQFTTSFDISKNIFSIHQHIYHHTNITQPIHHQKP